jgi:MYXO-CTERM domain-containing protein
MPVAQPEAVPADESQSGFAELDPDAALPIAGAGALGLILLGGAAAVRRRKRRKQEQADEAAKWTFIQSHAEEDQPQQVEKPAFAWAETPRHDPVPGKTPIAGAPTTRLPEGFDLSRFGPHVQAAYRGPTTDNPSLSLRHRLRRASFLDQQERRATEMAPAKPRDIPAKGNWESRSDADFMFRRVARPADKAAMQN